MQDHEINIVKTRPNGVSGFVSDFEGESRTPQGVDNRLRIARERRGISVLALAKKLGWSDSTIHSYEKGKTTPSTARLEILAEALGTTTMWLLSREPEYERSRRVAPVTPGEDLPEYATVADSGAEKETVRVERVTLVHGTNVYELKDPLTGQVTMVTAGEMAQIHRLLRILRSGDPELISAVVQNLKTFERLSPLARAEFASVIMSERRHRELAVEEDHRKAVS